MTPIDVYIPLLVLPLIGIDCSHFIREYRSLRAPFEPVEEMGIRGEALAREVVYCNRSGR